MIKNKIIGINAFHGHSSVCLISDGKIIHHEDFYKIYNQNYKKLDLDKSEIILVEINDLSTDQTNKFLEKNDARIILKRCQSDGKVMPK